MAMSALVNDGRLMRPYIVSHITDSSGNVIRRFQPRVVREVVSPGTALEVRRMLKMVMEEGGTGTLAQPYGYPSAGKTGTAQKFDKAANTYSDRKYVGSFIGFMPYDRPQLTVLVLLDEPWPRFYGGVVAGPVFKEIGEKVLPILNVAPPEPLPSSPVVPGEKKRTNDWMVRNNESAAKPLPDTHQTGDIRDAQTSVANSRPAGDNRPGSKDLW